MFVKNHKKINRQKRLFKKKFELSNGHKGNELRSYLIDEILVDWYWDLDWLTSFQLIDKIFIDI